MPNVGDKTLTKQEVLDILEQKKGLAQDKRLESKIARIKRLSDDQVHTFQTENAGVADANLACDTSCNC